MQSCFDNVTNVTHYKSIDVPYTETREKNRKEQKSVNFFSSGGGGCIGSLFHSVEEYYYMHIHTCLPSIFQNFNAFWTLKDDRWINCTQQKHHCGLPYIHNKHKRKKSFWCESFYVEAFGFFFLDGSPPTPPLLHIDNKGEHKLSMKSRNFGCKELWMQAFAVFYHTRELS